VCSLDEHVDAVMTAPPPDDDFDVADVLGAPPEFTSGQVAERGGIPIYRARRYWRALGFANVPDGEPAFTRADVDALSTLLALVGDGVVDDSQTVELARTLGRAAARLASSHAEGMVTSLDALGASGPERSLVARQLIDRVLPDLEGLLVYSWRRHLAVAMQRIQPHVSANHPTKITVGFADLVGFTELSRQLSEQDLALLVRRFENGTSDLITAMGGRVIKSLGDEVLYVAHDAATGARIALEIAEKVSRVNIPGIRIGLEYGPVVSHAGDVFGDTVNLASRLTAMAQPNHVLLGPALAGALASSPTFRLTPLPPVRIRGFGVAVPTELGRATSP
jgi:adenylate cyclase